MLPEKKVRRHTTRQLPTHEEEREKAQCENSDGINSYLKLSFVGHEVDLKFL